MKLNKARELLSEMYLNSLKEEVLPWRKGWEDKHQPVNPISNTTYRGINRELLTAISLNRGYKDPRWLTFNQVKQNEWSLEDAKGKGVPVEFWSVYDIRNKTTISMFDYKKVINKNPERVKDFRVMDRVYYVFNAEHINGIPKFDFEEQTEKLKDPSPFIDNLIKQMNVNYKEQGDRACYVEENDTVYLPDSKQFESQYEYESTKLHELCHATGHKTRLNRSIVNLYGTDDYAREELRAEISSSFIAREVSLKPSQEELSNHKAYIQFWIKTLETDPNELFKAIKDAEAISDYVLELGEVEKYLNLEQGKVNEIYVSKPRLFVDLDGVEAHFNNTIESLDVLHEKGYYRYLKPQQNVTDAVNKLIEKYPDQVYILSATLDSPYAAHDKTEWVKEFNPNLAQGHLILCPYGQPKQDYVPGGIQSEDVLLDDYSNNLLAWENVGGRSIKLINNINHSNRSWAGPKIDYREEGQSIFSKLEKFSFKGEEFEMVQENENSVLSISVNYQNNDFYSIKKNVAELNSVFTDVLSNPNDNTKIRVSLSKDGIDVLKNEKIDYHDLVEHQASILDKKESALLEILKDKAKNNVLLHQDQDKALDKYSTLDELFKKIEMVIVEEQVITVGPLL